MSPTAFVNYPIMIFWVPLFMGFQLFMGFHLSSLVYAFWDAKWTSCWSNASFMGVFMKNWNWIYLIGLYTWTIMWNPRDISRLEWSYLNLLFIEDTGVKSLTLFWIWRLFHGLIPGMDFSISFPYFYGSFGTGMAALLLFLILFLIFSMYW